MTRATIDSVSPFFIAGNVERSLDFYRDKLGFAVVFQETEPPHQTPFFAIVRRDGAMLFLKAAAQRCRIRSVTAGPGLTRTSWCLIRMRSQRSSRVAASASAALKDTHEACAASS